MMRNEAGVKERLSELTGAGEELSALLAGPLKGNASAADMLSWRRSRIQAQIEILMWVLGEGDASDRLG